MEIKTLGELCNIVSGGTPLRSKPEYWNNGTIPWIKIGDIKEKYINNADEYITKAGLDGSSAKMLPKGTILYTIFATLGEVGILEIDASTNQAIAGLTIKDKNQILSEYLYYYLKSKKRYVKTIGRGVAQSNINMSILKSFQVPLPSPSTQNKIIDVLDKITNIIEYHQQELQKLDDLIKARFVEMFVDKKYEKVNAGSIIKEMRNGVSPSTSGNHHEKVLTLSAITQGKFDDKEWKYGLFADRPSAEKRITEDSFYICRGNGNKLLVGMGVYSLENRPDLVFPDTVIAARIDKEQITLPYLGIMWQQPEIRKQIEAGARTTNGTYKINQKVISRIEITCPPLNEQIKFSDFVAQIDKSKATVQKALDETQLLFDSLMQQYFG